MTGKHYYLTTFAAWQRHAPRCAETHFLVLEGMTSRGGTMPEPADSTVRVDASPKYVTILVLVTADEAAHIALENDPEVEPLPHPLARTPISECAATALAHLGVLSGDDTFTVAEKLARINPLLRHRVF